jgi:hypothetical protein
MKQLNIPLVPVSWGEFTDKLTILEIKKEKIDNVDALANIHRELSYLLNILDQHDYLPIISELKQTLRSVNLKLWEIEDAVRKKTFDKEFDQEFIDLAVSVVVFNKQRHATKRLIDAALNSEISEEKQYSAYE